MTVRTRSQIISDANSLIPDNTTGQVSPSDVRGRVVDLADSVSFTAELGSAAFESSSAFAPASHVGAGGDAHAVVTTSANGFMTADMLTKLNGIAPGAQVNSVTSVAGKTGAVTVTASDVGLGNVNNTSDVDKPVSTATQTALDGKAAIAGGNDFSGPQRVAFTAHSIAAATLTLNLANNNGYVITMTGNPTIANPTNIAAAVGQEICLVFRGAYQPSFGSFWKFPKNEVPSFAGSLNVVCGIVVSATEIAAFGGASMGTA